MESNFNYDIDALLLQLEESSETKHRRVANNITQHNY